MKNILEGGCFVVHKQDLDFVSYRNWSEAEIIGKNAGSIALSQFYYEIKGSTECPVKSYSKSDCILFVLKGKGYVNISGRKFEISDGSGVYIKPGEAFSFENSKSKLEIIATVCPETKSSWLEKIQFNFQKGNNKRTVSLKERKKVATGDRFYQILVGKKMGSKEVTQFIGSIPKSKAPDHLSI